MSTASRVCSSAHCYERVIALVSAPAPFCENCRRAWAVRHGVQPAAEEAGKLKEAREASDSR